MKRILSLVCVGSLAFTLPVFAQNENHHRGGNGNKGSRGGTHAAVAGRGSVSRGVTTTHARVSGASHVYGARSTGMANAHVRAYNRTYNNRTNRTYVSHARVSGGTNAVVNRPNNRVRTFRGSNVTTNNRVRTQNNLAVNRQRNVNRNLNTTVNRTVNRQRNARIVNNWRSSRFSGTNYAAFRNYQREWHNRDWYQSRYSRIDFVLGGWWYWDAGYWYPAWGYAPGAYYPYYGPIYTGYAGLTPYQVTVNVQTQLQQDGYYAGPIDGVLGPQTRGAIAAFQADHGLAITSAIDEPTLATLGLT